MKHPSIEKWIDLARNVAPTSEMATLESHRAACRRCERTATRLRELALLAVTDAEMKLPRDVAVRAKAMFLAVRPERLSLLDRVTARLVYRSDPSLATVGVRSVIAHQVTHQALFEAGDYWLDVRVDHEGGARALLVGQILDRQRPDRKVAGVPVLLAVGDEIVNQTQSNRFGEFALDFAPSAKLKLLASVDGESRIEIPLGALGLLKANGNAASPTGSPRKRR